MAHVAMHFYFTINMLLVYFGIAILLSVDGFNLIISNKHALSINIKYYSYKYKPQNVHAGIVTIVTHAFCSCFVPTGGYVTLKITLLTCGLCFKHIASYSYEYLGTYK